MCRYFEPGYGHCGSCLQSTNAGTGAGAERIVTRGNGRGSRRSCRTDAVRTPPTPRLRIKHVRDVWPMGVVTCRRCAATGPRRGSPCRCRAALAVPSARLHVLQEFDDTFADVAVAVDTDNATTDADAGGRRPARGRRCRCRCRYRRRRRRRRRR